MSNVAQEQISGIARSISERFERETQIGHANHLHGEIASPSGQLAGLEQQLSMFKAGSAADRNLQQGVVERLEREIAVLRGEMAALVNDRAESVARIERLHRETQQAIDAMMTQVVLYLDERKQVG